MALTGANCLVAWGILVSVEHREPGLCIAKKCLVHWLCPFNHVFLVSNLPKLNLILSFAHLGIFNKVLYYDFAKINDCVCSLAVLT